MLKLLRLLLSVSISIVAAAGADPLTHYADAGSASIGVLETEWRDEGRQRTIPVKVYFPKPSEAKTAELSPVIIFSHGLGGTREGYEYLGRQWASHDYVSVHLQHPGSDDKVWKGNTRPMEAMRNAASNPANAIDRPKDVSFAIDQIGKLNETNPELRHRLDLNQIGVAGHSFGAYTTLAIAGQRGNLVSARDERVKAAIAMSAPVIAGGRGVSFDQIKIPVMHLTGTQDEMKIIGAGSPEDRRLPYDRITGAPQFLITFQGGDHMLFSGRRAEKDASALRLIRAATTAFWDASLRGDEQAAQWLKNHDGLEQALGSSASFEEK